MIELGQKVKDVVTGVEGIVVVISDHWHGAVRIEMQPPKKKDGTVPEIHVCDSAQIKVIDKKPIIKGITHPPARFQFGQKAKDPISGYEGTVNGRALFLNGCVRVALQANQRDYIKGAARFDAGTWFPEEVIVPTGWTIKPPKTEEPAKRTGGPALRVTREPRPSR